MGSLNSSRFKRYLQYLFFYPISKFILIFGFFTSCIYDEDKIYFNPILPPTNSEARISLNFDTDTIYVEKKTTFSFDLEPKYSFVSNLQIKLNNSTIQSLPYQEYTFIIEPDVNVTSTNVLTISFSYYADSNSLVGQRYGEIVSYKKSWVVIIDTTPPPAIQNVRAYIENGKSFVEWDSPVDFSFDEFFLSKVHYNRNGTATFSDTISFSNKSLTKYYDSTFIGGKITYSLFIKGYKYEIQSNKAELDVPLLEIEVDSSSYPIQVTWKKSVLYNNAIQFVIGGSNYSVKESGALQLSPRFGRVEPLSIHIAPKEMPSGKYLYNERYTLDIYQGKKIPAFESIEYIPIANVYLLLTKNSLLKLDPTSFEVTESLALPFSEGRRLISSRDGRHVYLNTMGLPVLNKIDYKQMTLGESIDLYSVLQLGHQIGIQLSAISNDNIISLHISSVDKGYLVDLTTKTKLWERIIHASTVPVISPDSKYLATLRIAYANDNNNWTTMLGVIPSSIMSSIMFKNTVNAEAIIFNNFSGSNNPSEVIDFQSELDYSNYFLVKHTIPKSYQYDYYSNHFFSVTTLDYLLGMSTVFDAETLMQIKLLNNIHEPAKLKYLNQTFFHQNGFIIH